ncbi:MAG: OsmC family protein [Proteobacteria bacterium]|nr:OsmC family protein [Pseudomonadota bacterium]
MSDASEKIHTFDVEFEAVAKSVGKMRTEAVITHTGSKDSWEMASDEGDFHGGDDTAPRPLAYFAMGTTSCLMTQIRAFAKRLKIEVNDVVMMARFNWRAEQKGREPYVGIPDGIAIDIELDSPATTEEQIRLIHTAQKGCFVEQIILKGMPIGHRLKVDGEWIDI